METPGIVYNHCLSVLGRDCLFVTELLRAKVRTSAAKEMRKGKKWKQKYHECPNWEEKWMKGHHDPTVIFRVLTSALVFKQRRIGLAARAFTVTQF